jgi:dihydroorotate dehydrogenase (NAD+) catalytic subunit
VAERLCACEVVAACEVNISCPNVKRGGLAFGTDPCTAGEVVAAVRKMTDKPIIAKLTPNVTDVAAIARSCVDAGADALSLTNTFRALAIDIRTHRPIIANNVGGLSGPAIKPLSLMKVHEAYGVARTAGVPILGGGGIVSGADALEFALAGASAVFVGTLLLRQPGACAMLLEEMRRLLAEQGVGTFAELVGKLELHD